jgi:hypothetical protein
MQCSCDIALHKGCGTASRYPKRVFGHSLYAGRWRCSDRHARKLENGIAGAGVCSLQGLTRARRTELHKQ